MPPKIKELVIHRNRKYAWKYGNSVGYNIGLTVEDDESNLMEMKELIHKELTTLAITEEERCRDEAGASAELERIKQTEDNAPLEEITTIEIAETKSVDSKYHVDPKFYVVLSDFEVKCLSTFQKYDSEGWDISDKQEKIWKAIQSKIKKAKGG
ncbi:hypothetical protein LCGC14_2708480 [marine sediment metagenome]|uniref:Uncharacterized protein n=1 Tax=marine sediment metagenome TaxID=412755 RepID=A0A0F9BMS7_9ZZZZ